MMLCFPSLISYEFLHGVCLFYDACHFKYRLQLKGLTMLQLILAASQVVSLVWWFHETSQERFPDDPSREKLGEWLTVFGCGCFFMTMEPTAQLWEASVS